MLKINLKSTFAFALAVYLLNAVHSLFTQNKNAQLYWVLTLGAIGCYLIVQ